MTTEQASQIIQVLTKMETTLALGFILLVLVILVMTLFRTK